MRNKSTPLSSSRIEVTGIVDRQELIADQIRITTNATQSEPCTWIVLPESEEEGLKIRCCYENCGTIFDQYESFRSHFFCQHLMLVQIMDSEGPCGIVGCDFIYDDVIAYKRHLVFHIYHTSLQWQGAVALEKADQRCIHVLREANKIFYNGSPLQCAWNECGGVFDDVTTFFSHVANHAQDLEARIDEDDQKYQCLWSDCKYATRRKYEVIQHLRHHSGEKATSCPTCGAFFANATKLIDHCTRQTLPELARLKCLYCNKGFPSERLLRNHAKRHINSHTCQHCEMSFSTLSTLRWHIMHRHTSVKTHVCMFCDKGFKTILDLERHYEKHNDGPPLHECRVCGKKFKWLQSQQAHERLHYQVDSKPYVCHLCPNKYRSGASLTGHLTTTHSVALPPGYSRFMYRKGDDGYFRMNLDRLEGGTIEDQSP